MDNYQYKDQLESEHLITRFLTFNDITTWKTFFEDKEGLAFLPSFGMLSNEEASQSWVERQMKRYENNLFGLQLLIDKNTGNVIGQCGLLLQDVEGKKEIEVGYHILKQFRGNGFATEAAQLFIDYAFQNSLCKSIISIIAKNKRL